ncbi:serine/threonine protein kinase [Myxococcus sp. K15C18031901]|uniref:serine/threonine-protein kinase n=1 Tax=Myxococcus dinghuensis TaxID=2906761 RepID=UPI0020A8241A|nr:serine/threonine-protein kinase [Myxococcus dinghuensis]MCP3097429.1 serine/threonine protein kinase [Myxococcus dinghuensis]
MREDHDAEWRAVLFEGLLSEAEVEPLREEAVRRGCSPLELLREQGRLSERTLASLAAMARAGGEPGLEGASTAEPGAPRPEEAPAPDGTPAFPVSEWTRYVPLRFLGQGGMGRVFLVHDPVLRRHVALKFVRDDAPDRVRRFIAEAQAQARVDHERVCKVYEVGEVRGHAYIAMQYVEGQPLHLLAGRLSPEQKALVLAQAAEGVHAAHRAGLIHRDLKPSNIVVERTADGQWKPYVMDFGLAKEPTEGVTATGSILGTPHFMAPEQARGEVGRLDRRADVYALGATLYALLVGQPPIPGGNALEVLHLIPTREPTPPRALAPDVPVDLEAIVLKCLEKDRADRYDSARALAEDLQRFLDGAPVQARMAGAGYRLSRLARKHWRVLALVAVAGVLVLFASAQALLARRDADLREHLARRFSELAVSVEARARYTALARLHDTRAERHALEAQLADITREMREGGERALGPGNEALGRGWLSVGEPARAREHLEAAWEHGTRTPRVACALALAFGQLYQEQLRAHAHLPATERQARRQELATRYREPALAWLRRARGADVPPSEYVSALLAFHEERHDDALARLDALGDRLPWFFEAPLLRGDVLVARATSLWDAGQRERALEDLDAARRAHAHAASIAESLPEAHLALAGVEQVALRMGLYGQGDVAPHIEKALEALGRGLTASPRHVPSLVRKAHLYRRLAEYQGRQGGDAAPALKEALEAARAALAVEPERSDAKHALGLALWQAARDKQARSQDPSELLRQAIDAFEGVAPGERGYDYHSNLGLIFKVWADYEDSVGEDSLAHRGRAIDAYLTAIGIDERVPDAWINLGSALFKRATHPRTVDPTSDLERARQALEKARALNPKNLVSHFYEAQVHALRASRLRDSGGDARPALEQALASYQSALALNDAVPPLHGGLGLLRLEQARDAALREEDALPLLTLAQTSFARAVALAPNQGLPHSNLSEALSARAEHHLARGDEARAQADARAALAEARTALAREPELAAAWANLGQAHGLLARVASGRGGASQEEFDASVSALTEALKRNPRDEEARRHLARTRDALAAWSARKTSDTEADFERAARAHDEVLAVTSRPRDDRRDFARLYLDWSVTRAASGRDARDILTRGLDLATEVLTARPGDVEAQALHLALELARARAFPSEHPGDEARIGAAMRDLLTRYPRLARVSGARPTPSARTPPP